MKELNERIKTNIMELGQKVYSQNPDDASAASNSTNDDVIETDFLEKVDGYSAKSETPIKLEAIKNIQQIKTYNL